MARGTSRIGELRQRVTIQRRSDAESGLYSGLSTRTNKPTAPVVWAKVVNVSGTQQVDSRNAGSGFTHEITIRYRTDVSVQDEILYTDAVGEHRYLIQTVQSAGDERQRFLVLECNQREKVGALQNPSPENP